MNSYLDKRAELEGVWGGESPCYRENHPRTEDQDPIRCPEAALGIAEAHKKECLGKEQKARDLFLQLMERFRVMTFRGGRRASVGDG